MEENQQGQAQPPLKILWAAQFFTCFIFAGLIHFDIVAGDPNRNPEEFPLWYILAFFALGSASASFFFRKVEKGKGPAMKIVSYALAESVTIFGMVGVLTGMPKQNFWSFFAVSIVLLLMYFPKTSGEE